ncbi:diguanylate cyclase [Aliikangiella marina]|uniref:diguanylate cyclase n=1 Tax=Aliikangiella marina TaxID=1712262 RepID=A0A545T0Z6_9GAMM|nr:sensor domain-containing diguanylate cyclase [Aliikangiella marina]TQV70887.1 diguanylate cyclase [Aliikangiella marina]
MNPNKTIHPILKNNYIPRLLASGLFVLSAFAEFEIADKSAQFWLLILFALSWPHIARFSPFFSKESKQSELVNMHIDAIFSAIFLIVLSTYHFAGLVLAILVANALFIGFFKLLLSTLATFFSLVLLWHLFISPIDLQPASIAAQLVGGAFVIFYYSTFATMGYHLTRNMIKLNRKVEALSQTDPLTGCFNRLYLDSNLNSELNRSNRLNYPLCLIFADIDHFKQINDHHGHVVGDAILREFVHLVTLAVRNEFDWVARYGGEEFVIVLPNSDLKNGTRVAERIQKKLAQHKISVEDSSFSITCSFGISCNNTPSNLGTSELIKQADKALYLAKHAGRNCIKTAKQLSNNEPR